MGKTEHQEITLPYDMDAEQATLAGILHDPDQLESLRLKPGDFHHAMHKDIFRAMQSLQRQALPLTWVRMHQEVCSLPGVEREPVSITYLSEVFDSALSSAHLADHAAVVKEKVRKRELILSMSKLTEKAQNGTHQLSHAQGRMDGSRGGADRGSSRAADNQPG